MSVAPYHVHLVASDDGVAAGLYGDLLSADVEVLYDDRREIFGTKFKDADLIEAPLRLTLTPRSLKNGGVEVKLRREKDSRVVPISEVVPMVRKRLFEHEAELAGTDWGR